MRKFWVGLAIFGSATGATAQEMNVDEIAGKMSAYDVTESGTLSGTELDACGCAAFDLDGDSEVSLAEFTAGLIVHGEQSLKSPPETPRVAAEAARGPSPAPAAVQAQAGPPIGKYGCHYTRFGTIVPSGNMITITGAGEYRFFDQGSGRFSVEGGTGTLGWTSGPLAGSGVQGTYYRRESDGKPAIKLVLAGVGRDHLGRPYDQTNYCILH